MFLLMMITGQINTLSDGNQAHTLLMVSRLGQLWPNEIQKPYHAHWWVLMGGGTQELF